MVCKTFCQVRTKDLLIGFISHVFATFKEKETSNFVFFKHIDTTSLEKQPSRRDKLEETSLLKVYDN